ncbi:unnamed protein product [Cuscuta europaea]|uniref:DUF4005 domain-containing protein n=1 Tax=Cuscuta europaea TaxID=41803 RepID=A0A9P1E0Q4_CUSEU|nr:unnamed protein product [Cuscuta europaea]
MGKKGSGWFSSVKKVFYKQPMNDSPNNKEDRNNSGDDKWDQEAPEVVSLEHYFPSPDLTSRETNGNDSPVDDPNRAISVALSTAAAAAAAAKAAAEVFRLAGCSRWSKPDRAATLIQSHYRGYLARRALRALRALVRLQALVRGNYVRKQTLMTMRCMQSLVRVQGRVKAGRVLQSAAVKQKLPSISHHSGGVNIDFEAERSLQNLEERMRKLGKTSQKEQVEKDDDEGVGNAVLEAYGGMHDDSEMKRERDLAYAAYAYQDKEQIFWDSSASDHHHEVLFGKEEPQWRRSWMASQATESSRPQDASCLTISSSDGISEKTVEIDFPTRLVRPEHVQSTTRYNFINAGGASSPNAATYGRRQTWPGLDANVPSFMAPTQSAKAKARTQQDSNKIHTQRSAQWNSSTKSRPTRQMGSRSPNLKAYARQAKWMPTYDYSSPESSGDDRVSPLMRNYGWRYNFG